VQADAGGATLLRAGGYDPKGLVRLMALTTDVQPTGWAQARAEKLNEEIGK